MVYHAARFLAGVADPAQLPKLPYPEIAFAGRSNVGKSSLLNRLVARRRLARVSKTPGRTQQINFFLVDERLTLVDLPGYGFARVPVTLQRKWKHLVETYLSKRENLRAVVLIVDLRRGVEAEDTQLIGFLHTHDVEVILALTKADRLGHGERRRRVEAVRRQLATAGVRIVPCSSTSGEGVEHLWAEIEGCCR